MTSNAVPSWTRADRLRKARECKGLTQAQMGEELFRFGIVAGRSKVGAWETGANRPLKGVDAPDLYRAWAEITDVDRDWLIYGTPGGLTSSWGVVGSDLPEPVAA